MAGRDWALGFRIGAEELEDLAIGAAILGTGGGGDPYIGKLLAKHAIDVYGEVDLIDPDDVPDDALVIPTAMMGAPTVLIEKIPRGDETLQALRLLEKHLDKRAYATMPIESGGVNSTIPIAVAARARIPVVDADGMGRAFPELQMESFHIYGIEGSPIALVDERGDSAIVRTVDNFMLEWIARGITIRMGGTAHIAEYAMSGKDLKRTAIRNTISLGIKIGRAVRDANRRKEDPVEAIMRVTEDTNYGRAIELFRGKIVDVQRRTTAGFAVGNVSIEGLDRYEGKLMNIRFQNENLVATVGDQVVATVPDLITVLHSDSGLPITTEWLKYGYRVVVIGIPTPEIMRTPEALKVWGPAYFGYKDIEYKPLELLHKDYYAKHRLPKEKENKYGPILRG
jgi:DUF917 family protein